MLKPVQASTYTFRSIVEGGFLYVDKTRYLYDLVNPGSGVYFMSRPRRFGKSLMLSTLAEFSWAIGNFFKDCGSIVATMIGSLTPSCGSTSADMVLRTRQSWNR